MANNIDVKDATGTTKTMQTLESGGVHTPVHIPTGELLEAIQALRMATEALLRAGAGLSLPDTSGRLRVAVDAINATTLGTVTTVTNLTNFGSYNATQQIPSMYNGGADSLRRNISVT